MIIITGKGEEYGLNREDFLPVTTTDRKTRMNTKTLLGRSDYHQKGLSIMDIQKDLVEEYIKENPNIMQQDEKTLKESISTYIRNLNTKERKMTLEILQGEFVYYDYQELKNIIRSAKKEKIKLESEINETRNRVNMLENANKEIGKEQRKLIMKL